MTAKVDFQLFGNAVRDQYNALTGSRLYLVDADKDAIWQAYLESFPPGTNEVFRERTEHDCSCCKNFIRNLGCVVSIMDGDISTVWDIPPVGYPFDIVAKAMADHVRSLPIKTIYKSKEGQYGAESSKELRGDKTFTWNHFSGKVPKQHRMASGIGEFTGKIQAAHQVLSRGVDELKAEAFDSVLDLIAEGALYRGNEHKASILEFQRLKNDYEAAGNRKELFLWENVENRSARFRNTVIGTLIVDLSDGRDIESAVKAFEDKVAPANYKRPTALITKGMIDKAMATLDELGLRSAVERRHATISDVSVNDVMFVDNAVKPLMRDVLADSLMESVKPTGKVDVKNATDIGVEDFFKDVLPIASGIEILLENRHMGNLMSVTAPVGEGVGRLFKWGNDFAWSYKGDVTDSVKERVKKAGGNIDAKMRVSLSWFNTDDLDIHVIEPCGNEIFYGNKCGKLDVDMNVRAESREAVENVSWNGRIADGKYVVKINNYTKRESVDVGFDIQFEMDGDVRNYSYAKAIPSGKTKGAITIEIDGGTLVGISAAKDIIEGSASQDQWGISTQSMTPVNTIILSPNHWGDKPSGNKHWFFLLKDCKNPDPVRGIYNEFLNPKLEQHRKVFEVLGSKTKCQPSDDQLSGVGFSSTKRDTATVIVKTASSSRAFNIQF